MKIILLLLCLVPGILYAQKMPDMGVNRVRIIEQNVTILAAIDPVKHEPAAKTALFYYWYSANLIHITQGGFSGKLLNGQYNEYYLNKNLKEQGNFKKGLKDGIWKSWNEDGMINETATWKNGEKVVVMPSHFWKRINIFKRRSNRSKADSLSKPGK